MTRGILGLLGLVCFGCATTPSFVALVHPKSQDIQVCRQRIPVPGGNTSVDYTNIFQAQAEVRECQQQLELLGYIQAKDLTPEQRDALSPKIRSSVEVDQKQTIRSE